MRIAMIVCFVFSFLFFNGFCQENEESDAIGEEGNMYEVKEGDTVGWRKESTKSEYYKQLAQTIESKTVPDWLSLDKKNLVGQVVSLPTPEAVEAAFDGKTIVEHYSR